MRRAMASMLLAGALGALGVTGAMASGGGGGGGGEMPSQSAPSYDPAAEYAKGVAALQAQKFKEAARAFNHVIEVIPQNPDAWRLLGASRAGDGDWKGSRSAYERAVRYAPDEPSAHAGLGLALANLKDAKAQAQLDWLNGKIAACGTGCSDGDRLKALAAAVQGALSAAPATSKPSARLDNRSLIFGSKAGDAAYVQAVSLINDHHYDAALAVLGDAQAAFGPHPDILTYQGYAWRKKGDYDRAEGYYRQALAIAPSHRGATEYYGELKVERGDLAGARRMLARLDETCAFGCAEAEELRRWIDLGGDPQLR